MMPAVWAQSAVAARKSSAPAGSAFLIAANAGFIEYGPRSIEFPLDLVRAFLKAATRQTLAALFARPATETGSPDCKLQDKQADTGFIDSPSRAHGEPASGSKSTRT